GVMFLPSYINLLKETRIVDDLPEEKKKKIKTLLNLEAKDIMSNDVVTVPPEMEITELLEFMKKTRFNTLPVTDNEKNMLGLVTLVDVIGMAKQNRDAGNYNKLRDADELVRDVHSWWKKTFVFIRKVRIKSWKFIFVTAFIAGAIAAIIWMVSVKIQTKSGAEEKRAKVFLASDDIQINEEQLFNVDIIMDTDGQMINVADAVINYDPSEFTLELWDTEQSVFSVKDGCIYEKNPCHKVKNNPEKGEIEIYLAAPKGIAAYNNKIANLVFRTKRVTKTGFPTSKFINVDSSRSSIRLNKKGLLSNGEDINVLNSVSGVSINVIHPESGVDQ
ncbi:MAG TPA: CBS domain-containing protein, partial [Patescibacteria group bacterium]|nr:CBS domain-containing protein [Patescibacteria group bacterium]